MVRPKDPFWEHAKDLKNGRFLCKFCDGQFAGGISRVKWHLSGLEGNDVKVCEKVPRDIQLAVLQVLDTPNKKERQVKVSKKKRKDRQVEDVNYCSVPSSSDGPNLCMDNVLMGKKLGKLFLSFGIHPKVIVSPIFEDFVKSIVEYGPSTYQLASTFTDEKGFASEVDEEADEYIENFINDPIQAGCTLMVNNWQRYDDSGRVDRVDIFAYSKKGAACFKSFKYEQRLGGVQEVISSTIDQLLRLNLHVVQLLLSQGTFHNDVDREFLKIKNYHTRICVSNCAAQEIDDFLFEMELDLHYVISLVRFIFATYHHYNVSSQRGTKRPKKKYAFIFVMLKSVLEIEDELQKVSFSSITESSDLLKLLDEKENAKYFRYAKLIDYIIGRKEFWSRVKAVEQVWFLVVQTRCLVNCKGSSIGYLYQMIERLKDGIEKSREYDHFVYDRIWERFIHMRRKIIHPIHAAAAFLDPAYICTKNFAENDEMIDGTNYMLENMVDSNEKKAFEKELDQYREELPKLFTAQAMITMLKTCHPRTWWDFCGKHTPILRKYAIRILSQPCSTLFCRRYEVPLGDLSEDWTTKVNTMIINGNSKLLELEPIILDKLVEDHDAFKDVTELDEEYYYSYLSSKLTDDALVDCVINDPSPSFWDKVNNIKHLLLDCFV